LNAIQTEIELLFQAAVHSSNESDDDITAETETYNSGELLDVEDLGNMLAVTKKSMVYSNVGFSSVSLLSL